MVPVAAVPIAIAVVVTLGHHTERTGEIARNHTETNGLVVDDIAALLVLFRVNRHFQLAIVDDDRIARAKPLGDVLRLAAERHDIDPGGLVSGLLLLAVVVSDVALAFADPPLGGYADLHPGLVAFTLQLRLLANLAFEMNLDSCHVPCSSFIQPYGRGFS